MTIKQQLISELSEACKKLGLEVSPTVDYPTDPKHGDYSTNIALIAFKRNHESGIMNQEYKTPLELANGIIKILNTKYKIQNTCDRVEVAKPGFINFWVKDEALVESLNLNIPQNGKGKTIIIEYSSPNIAKPFTIGHLRSTIIGDAIANLLSATGFDVKRDNHVGDWGTQFGKQIYAIKKWGNEKEIEKSQRPVKMLVDLYVKFHKEAEKDASLEDQAREWFKKLEDRDEEARKLWEKCIEWSWREFEKIYIELGVPSGDNSNFENNGRGYGESFFEDKMDEIIRELEEKELLKTGENGAKLVFYDDNKFPPLMMLKKDGATLYSTRDLATDKFRLNKYENLAMIINEVGAEQTLYFKQLYKLEEMLGWYKKGQRVHKMHGLYRFKEGKMSTRKGNVIWLEEVLEEAEKRAFGLQKHLSEFEGDQVITKSSKTSESARKHTLGYAERINLAKAVGIGALKWNDLKRSSEQDIVFDWDEILTMQGNSGPYLQYTFARTQSVLAKSGLLTKKSSEMEDYLVNPKGLLNGWIDTLKCNITQSSSNVKDKISKGVDLPGVEPGRLGVSIQPSKPAKPTPYKVYHEERDLLRLLARFSEIVGEAAERLVPNLLCTYLFELAQVFNLFYQKHQILREVGEVREFRLALTKATGEILKKGLLLLGIKAPEKM